MEFKDWLLIIIPIACNGILLFLFQQSYLTKIKEIERKNTYKMDVLKEFLGYLQEFYKLIRNFQKADNVRSGITCDFVELWNPAAGMIQDLVVFADTHPIAIEKSNIGFEKCLTKWQQIADMLYDCKVNNNGRLSEQCAYKFNEYYIEMNELVKNCMEYCEKEIMY